MLKSYFLLLALCFSDFLYAQESYPIQTAAGSFTPVLNEGRMSEIEWNKIPLYEGHKYLLLQFSRLPSESTLATMKAKGIELLTYLPKNTYHAKVSEIYDASRFEGIHMLSVFALTAVEKIHLRIKSGDIPPYALDGSNYKLMLSLQKGVNATAVVSSLKASGARILNIYNQQHITLSIHPSKIELLASFPFVEFIDLINAPMEKENILNKTDHRSNTLNSDYGAGRHYDGFGVRVALTDDGNIGPHIDYTGRTHQEVIGSLNNGNHGDHCGGTIMGAGNLNPLGRGMAPGCEMWVYEAVSGNNYILDDTLYTSPNTSIDVVSTSYSDGCNSGYNAGAESADRQIRTFKNVMRVFSAGNNGTSNCSYGAGAGWGNITGGIKSAKNLICVANLTYDDIVASSSSRGPATDGRLKPDVSGVGTDVYSTIDTNQYELKTGTSMSCPGVAGVFTQLYQAYRALNGGQDPNTGLLKGIMMNTCDDVGNPGPDFKYGYGRINGLRAVKTLEGMNYNIDSVNTGVTKTSTIVVPPNTQRVKIMLNWLDREAAVSATTALVNDLDLNVTDPSANNFLPWVLNPAPVAATLDANAIRAVDHLNNAEQVTIDNPIPGTYTISVNGFAVPFGPQEYYITYEIIADDALEVIYPIGGEGFIPGESQSIRWDAIDNGNTFSIDYSIDNGSSWISVMTGIISSRRVFNWTVPNTVSGACKVRVKRNTTIANSPSVFSIMPTPTNLKIDWACPDTIQISWAPNTNATHYQVFKLGNKFMDSVATTTDTFYQFVGLNIADEHWFSVKGFNNTNNALSRRAFALNHQPGLLNCILQNDAQLAGIVNPAQMTLLNCIATNPIQVKCSIYNGGTLSISNLPVHYQFNGLSSINEVYSGTIAPGTSYEYTFTTPLPSALSPGVYPIMVWNSLAGDQFTANDTMTYSFAVASGTTATLPWKEDFETTPLCSTVNECDFTNCALLNNLTNEKNTIIDDFDWKVNDGPTPTTNTGPDVDHTLGNSVGNYIYLETSYCFDKKAYLLSPCFNFPLASKPYLSYWYHLYGASMGELHLDAYLSDGWDLDIIPPVVGDQGNSWKKVVVDLSAYVNKTVYFRWRGITGPAQRSDMALDDLSVIDSANSVGIVPLNQSFQVYPNPSSDFIEVQSISGSQTFDQVSLYDPLGAIVYESKFSTMAEQTKISLASFAKGIYFLVLKKDDKIVYRNKIVKE